MRWNLRPAAANRGIWKASQLQQMLAGRGLVISAGKMSGLWSGDPASIKLSDLDVICAGPTCARPPALASWSSSYDHLREKTGEDILAGIGGLTGHERHHALSVIRSLFRHCKKNRTIFRDPAARRSRQPEVEEWRLTLRVSHAHLRTFPVAGLGGEGRCCCGADACRVRALRIPGEDGASSTVSATAGQSSSGRAAGVVAVPGGGAAPTGAATAPPGDGMDPGAGPAVVTSAAAGRHVH